MSPKGLLTHGTYHQGGCLQNKLMPLLDVMKRYNLLDAIEYFMRKRGLADRCYREPHKPIDETTGRKLEAEMKDHLTVVEKLCE